MATLPAFLGVKHVRRAPQEPPPLPPPRSWRTSSSSRSTRSASQSKRSLTFCLYPSSSSPPPPRGPLSSGRPSCPPPPAPRPPPPRRSAAPLSPLSLLPPIGAPFVLRSSSSQKGYLPRGASSVTGVTSPPADRLSTDEHAFPIPNFGKN